MLAGAALVATTLLPSTAWAQVSPPLIQLPGGSPESGSLASIPAALISEALTVSILASVSRPSETSTWEARDIKYTIPGTSVSVKMIGKETAIVITVTPYKDKKGGLMLVVQGQVWYKDGEAGVGYRTTVDTLTVGFGERVLFYPFGASSEGSSPLRVELIMDKYVPSPEATPGQGSAEVAPVSAKDKAKP
jgi:hypothetical protein